MALTHFISPLSGEEIPIEQAPAYFEDQGIMPGDVVQAMIRGEQNPAHNGTHIGPSIGNPETTCRREVVGKRFLNYKTNPRKMWAAMEGTMFHSSMVAHALPGWESARRVPAQGTGTV